MNLIFKNIQKKGIAITMNEKIEWLKENKKEVLIGTGLTVGTIALIVIGVKKRDVRTKRMMVLMDVANKKVKDLSDTFQRSVDSIDKHYGLDLEAVPIKELGNIGDNFLKNTPGSCTKHGRIFAPSMSVMLPSVCRMPTELSTTGQGCTTASGVYLLSWVRKPRNGL